jgi:hypothetical protein
MARPMTTRTQTSRRAAERAVARPIATILALALLAALLLLLAEVSTVASVSLEGESCEVVYDTRPELADRCSLSGWERHGGALILLALLAAGAALAVRAGRIAAAGAVLVAIGLVTLGVTLIGDLPVTDDTGAIGSTDLAAASASAGLGFYLELLGALLCLAAGALALAVARREPPPDAS